MFIFFLHERKFKWNVMIFIKNIIYDSSIKQYTNGSTATVAVENLKLYQQQVNIHLDVRLCMHVRVLLCLIYESRILNFQQFK